MTEQQEFCVPLISKEDVPYLVERIFGFNVHCVKQLNGYDDKNFFVKEIQENRKSLRLCEFSADGYILKVLNSEDSKNVELVEAQNSLMQFLSSQSIIVPVPQKNMEGKFISIQTSTSLQYTNQEHESFPDLEKTSVPKHIVRLFSFIPGQLMKDVVYTEKLLHEVGQFTANLDNKLKGFSNPSIEKREYRWKLSALPEISQYLYAVKDGSHRDLIKEILTAWKNIEPLFPFLEAGIIHSDLNEQNILVKPDDQDPKEHHICGLLDFGDVSHSPLIFELAIAIAYVVMEVESMDPIEAGRHVLNGYSTKRQLNELEWDILKVCVAGRFAQSLVLGEYYYSLNPDNHYLICTAKKGWERLSLLWAYDKDRLIDCWKNHVL